MNINWYPGHMSKTKRLISDNLKLVDAVLEVVDARIPKSSRNPDIDGIIGPKPKIIVLNKSDMADAAATARWIDGFKKDDVCAVAFDSIKGRGMGGIRGCVDFVLREKTKRNIEKGMKKLPARLMIVGIPNVGKSSFINKLCGRASAKTGDRPGVTKSKQWIRLGGGYELLDTPGILWPRFDEDTGLSLAFTGAIKDEVFDTVEVACRLCLFLAENYSENIIGRYKLSSIDNMKGYEILEQIGKNRGCIVSGGEIDLQRASAMLLDEFRSCKLGKITLEHFR